MSAKSPVLDRGYANLPLPFGWFAVSTSGELAPGQVRTLRYFGTEFVVWRGEDGTVCAADPFCPHLGAHLGESSEVIGNDLRCAFHHWSFNGQGGVTSIPYTKIVPPRLKRSCLKTWPVTETDGVIFVWYHPARAEPKWEVASLPKCPEGDWVLAETHDWVVNIHCQEITENGQDHAHFGAVHGVASAPKGEFRLEGWVRRNTVVVDMPTPRGPMSGKIDVTATGPGQSITEYIDVTHVVQSQQVTPIDSEHTHVRWHMYHIPGLSDGRLRVTKARMRDLVKQINEDIPIWNRKRYMPEPLLVEGDGPMMAYRAQYERFYQFDDAKAEPVPA